MTKSSIEHDKGATIRNIYVETQTAFPRACGRFKNHERRSVINQTILEEGY